MLLINQQVTLLQLSGRKQCPSIGENPAHKTNNHEVIGGQLSITGWDSECQAKEHREEGRSVSLGSGGGGMSRSFPGEHGLGLGWI